MASGESNECDPALGLKKAVDIADVPICFHTTHYERFFVITLDLCVQGDPVHIEGVHSGRFYSGGYKLTSDTILDVVGAIGKKYEVAQVARIYCGHPPLVQVFFSGGKAILAFLKGREKFEAELQQELGTLMGIEEWDLDLVTVSLCLFLAVPEKNRELGLFEVTARNLRKRMETFHEGSKFDLGSLIDKAFARTANTVLSVDSGMADAKVLLAGIKYWFALGVLLKVNRSGLERLRVQHHYSHNGLEEVIRMWLESGTAKWILLAEALDRLGYCAMATDLNARKGMYLKEGEESRGDVEGFPKALCEEQLKVKKLGKERDKVHSEVCQLEWIKESLPSEVKEVQESLERLSETVSFFSETKDTATKKLALKKERLDLMNKSVDSFGDHELWVELVDELKYDIKSLNRELETTEPELQQYQGEKDDKEQELASKLKELETAEEKLGPKKKELARADMILDVARWLFDLHIRRLNLSTDRQLREVKAQIELLHKEMSQHGITMEKKDLLRAGLAELQLEQEQLEQSLNVAHEGEEASSIPSASYLHEKSWADGQGLQFGTCWQTASFIIKIGANESSRLLKKMLSCCVSTSCDSQPVDCTVTEAGRSKFKVSYIPITSGIYEVRVTVKGIDVNGSPFSVKISSKPYDKKGEPVHTVIGLSVPCGVAVSKTSGRIIVSESDSVTVFDRKCTKLLSFGSKGLDPGMMNVASGIALAADDSMIIADCGNHRIQLFSQEGKHLATGIAPGRETNELSSPRDVAIHPNGQIYVVDSSRHCVLVFHSDLTFSHSFGRHGSKAGEFENPHGLAVNGKGRLYIADSGNNRIQVFSPSGRHVTHFAKKGIGRGSLSHPVGVAIDSRDNVYISEQCAHAVSVFTSNGEFLRTFGRPGSDSGEFEYLQGIALDSSGNLYVCDSANSLLAIL